MRPYATERFSSRTWEHLFQPGFERHVTVLAAVPIIYLKLILDDERKLARHPQTKEFVREQCSQMTRLMMCDSASLPESIRRR
ncbi:unnamed protein product [Rotaria socialis]|nr:unnamed protein product [Rotaria socialis]CAF3165274.1 unnamed protein product [Rotaria socialis]CAF4227492.1 unnamed protein product [Rotaria socialis]CAF4483601.1 unnamed protein product [Rotaria socialis]CAF4832548.1 unnamed protein product [Rotaria socialis]